jgi:outer membrane protein TolC
MKARNKKREASRESRKTFQSRRWLLVSLFSSFCLLILRSPVIAADAPVPLTWQECVRLAARNNPDLISALRAMQASRAQYYGSYNGIFPHLSLSNSYSDSKSAGLGESKSWQAEGTASLDLIDFGQWASIQSASAGLKLSQANLEVSATTTLLNLYKAFAALLYAQEEVQVNTNIRDIWKMNAQMIDLRYKSGSESRGNNMNTQAQLLQSEVGLAQAGRDTQTSQQQLGQVLGMDEFHALTATGTWDTPPVPMPHPDFSAMLMKIPQIRAQAAVVEQAQAAIKAAQSTLWPTLSLNYSKGTQGGSEFPSSPFWAFTGVASYPLFGGGPTSTYYATQAAQRSYDKALQDLRSLRNQTLTNLENAWSAYAQAQDQIRVQRAFLEADRQRKAEYDILYQSGLMSFQEWILVVEEYVNFQTSFLRAEQNLILAQAQWRFATGEQLGEQR